MNLLATRASVWPSPRRPDRWRRVFYSFVLVYIAVTAVLLAMLPVLSGVYYGLSNWIAAPLQLVTIFLSASNGWRFRTRSGRSRWLWPSVCAFSTLNLIATYFWVVWRPTGIGPVFSYADVLYLADYWVMTVTYALLFAYDGSFRLRRFWFDATTIFTTLVAVLWVVLLSSASTPGVGNQPGLLFSLPYVLTLVPMMTMAALLWISLPNFRRHPVAVLLIGAGLAEAVWEIAWLASWRTNIDFVGAFYNFGDVICFALIILAVVAARQSVEQASNPLTPQRNAFTFLPTLATVLGLALVAGTMASTRSTDTWILVGLVILSALLLVARHNAVTREMAELNHELAVHEADARLTELARQSTDLFLVTDKKGLITFASAAAEDILGAPATRLTGQNILMLFGPVHRASLSGFLTGLAAKENALGTLEFSLVSAGQSTRVLKISGANRTENKHVRGITMTVSDVTEQRSMERAVLDAATRERIRLASEIHDGLGQELVGISLLIQGEASAPDSDPARQSALLNVILGHLRKAISDSRDLARNLSPIYVVRGSLSGALQDLCQEKVGHQPVSVRIDPSFHDTIMSDLPADHLYRIAREAIHNAFRHSGCTHIEVTLRVQEGELLMVIADDGRGIAQQSQETRTLGMRLMEYRARVIGGRLKIEGGPQGGTQIQVSVPLKNVVPEVKSA